MLEKHFCKMYKSMFIVSSSVALGIGAYAAYRYWKKRESKCIDEGFEDISKIEESPEKKILVLGLQNSGKTALVSQITTESLNVDSLRPTEGFHVTSLDKGEHLLNIWDVGGTSKIRRFWSNFLQDTDLLVFVVDATDTNGIAHAVKELKELLGDERLEHTPLMIVASKQDLPGALSPEQVGDALDVKSIPKTKHKVKVLGCQLDPTMVHSSVVQVKKVMLEMIK